MLRNNKSKAFTFICSFLPGAAEMYLGFMKNGLTLMLAFFISFMLPTALGAGDIFIALVFVVWFYGFFHARNLAGSDEATFAAMEDRYIWEEFCESKNIKLDKVVANKWFAVILILIGVSALWNRVFDIVCRYIPESVWNDIYPVIDAVPGLVFAILVIIAGIVLIKGKKESLTDTDAPMGIEDKSANNDGLSS